MSNSNFLNADSQSSSQNSNFNQSSGGFFNSPGKHGTPSPVRHEKKEFLQNIVPCTVAQLLKIKEEESIKIGNTEAYIVTIIGKLHLVQKSSTHITFILDDMSGPSINVKLWLNLNEQIPNKYNSISNCSYTRVIGRLRFIQGECFIHALKLIPLKDLNEISMHLLEIIHTAMNQGIKESLNIDENFMEISPPLNLQSHNSIETILGLSKEQTQVLRCIAVTKIPIGVSYDYLFSQLKTMNKHAILKAVEFLCNEGHLYNTIDDDHFRATDEDLF